MEKTMGSKLRAPAFVAVLLTALFAVLATASVAGAAEPSAKAGWYLSITPYPTNFAPGAKSANADHGPGYALTATNVGAAPTSGKFTITDTLPAGVVPSPAQVPFGQYGPNFASHALSCEAVGQTVSCSGAEPLFPGHQARAFVPLEVEAGAPVSILDHAVVEGGGAPPASATMPSTVSSEAAPIGFLAEDAGAQGSATNADGSTATLAGSHPYQLTVGMAFSNNNNEGSDVPSAPGGGVRDVTGEIPQGMVVNPAAVPQCTEADLENEKVGCPEASQIGTVGLSLTIVGEKPARGLNVLYNMVPPPGVPAEFAFEVIGGIYIHLLGRVRSDSHYELAAGARNIPAPVGVLGAEVTFWGDPSDSSHDHARGDCLAEGGACELKEELHTAGLSLPSSCGEEPLQTLLRIDNWIGEEAQASYPSTDANGNPVGVDGCNQLLFEPTIEARPTTNLADSPSGLEFNLHQPQEEAPDGRASANLKDTTVALPAGIALNPSAAAGLGACSEAELGSDGAAPAHCPGDSKLGSVEVKTPLLEDPLPGAVYLASPYANPSHSLIALYLVVEDEKTGVVAKLPGKVEADPKTGQLTASFKESPELPLEDVHLHFYPGARAALTTPFSCGTYTTSSDLTPWSTPEGADAHPSDSFQTTTSPGAGACPGSEAGAANSPAFSGGTVSPAAGAYSPFVLHLSRADGTQHLAGIDTTLPEGLTGRLAGIPYCSEADIAAARSREAPNRGAEEIAAPSCPAASELGTLDTGAGSGPTPFHVGGHLYLAGPYKGAPLSMVAIAPAVAGPFDLGDVVVRIALQVDPETAQIHAVSDPFPQIIDGIPLDLRSVAVRLGRPQFTLNPTNCNPMALSASALSALGQSAALSSAFQVGGCSTLPFKPKLAISIKGATKRGGHPALKAVATAKPGEANIAKVSVALPPTEFLDQDNIKTICTKVQFAANQCPAGSIYGKATAITPLLDTPLSGPVYLRSSTHKLPDLVVALKGPASQPIEVVLAGRVDTFHKGLRNSFEGVPDGPVSKFTLEMQGGPKKGLIENSANICNAANKATVLMDGQNGKVHDFEPVLKTSCGGKGRKPHKKR